MIAYHIMNMFIAVSLVLKKTVCLLIGNNNIKCLLLNYETCVDILYRSAMLFLSSSVFISINTTFCTDKLYKKLLLMEINTSLLKNFPNR
jgi:hypothetical protein